MIFYSALGVIFYILVFFYTLYLTCKNKWYTLNEKNLLQQKVFWLAIVFPVFSFFYFGLFAWWGKTPVLSAHGYARFYEISKFPLMLLASSVPLGAIVNNIHRTIQTERQIYESERKNNFDITINHMKHYTELFKKIETEQIIEQYEIFESINKPSIKKETVFSPKIHYPNNLYKKLFISKTNKKDILFITDKQFLNKIKYDWKHLNFCFKKLHRYNLALQPNKDNGNFRAAKCKIYFEICAAYETLCNTLELGDFRPKLSFGFHDKDNTFQIDLPFYNNKTLYKSIKTIEKLSLGLFDIVRDENVDIYFPTNQRLFIYGPSIIDNWSYYFDNGVIMDELPSRISSSHTSFNVHR
ncbi:TPA: hypothetical protein MIN91_19860 [Klebsiella pneumoniae]|nr:hypothetical protein [Klebsiella pneumoniae]HBY0237164.1 hypothetical protein [Klebsiella pneumoniae]